jgi:hypothetical protein
MADDLPNHPKGTGQMEFVELLVGSVTC